ncbi:MAG: hypothetical protein FD167_4728, partial [bacterium]
KDLIEPYEPSNQIQASSMTITDSLLIVLPLAGRGSLTVLSAEAEESTVVAGKLAATTKTPTIQPGTYSQSELDAATYFANQGHDVTLRMPTGTRAGGWYLRFSCKL